jgi:hypothetical protein
MERTWIRKPVPEWDCDLKLFIWLEIADGEQFEWYIMDKEGHYRFWRSGWYVGKIPRENKENEQRVEE